MIVVSFGLVLFSQEHTDQIAPTEVEDVAV